VEADQENPIEPMIQTNPNRKKIDVYGSDQKPNRTNRKPKWFGSVLGSGFQIQLTNRAKPIYSIYVKLFF
jgi:(p)ppGpp synthase/HD superfamily hydrolase